MSTPRITELACLTGFLLVISAATARADRPQESGHPEVEASGDDTPRFLYSRELGDVHAKKTTNEGPLHFFGSFGVSNADYSRGRFDDIPESFDIVEYPVNLSAVFELPQRGNRTTLNDFALTVGSGNDLASERQPGVPAGSDRAAWYESDHYVGVTAHLGGDWIGGITYVAFASPNDASPTGYELAVAARYTGRGGALGRMSPGFKIAAPTDSSPGVFTELTAAPTLRSSDGGRGGKLSLPFAVGIGARDYYGPDTGTEAYGSVGITFTKPFGAERYGIWNFSVGVDAVYRTDAIASAGGPFADHDAVVYDAALLVHFFY